MKKLLSKLKGWLPRGGSKPSGAGSGERSGVGAAAIQSLKQVRLQNPIKSVGMKLFLIFFVCILVFVLVMGITSFEISKSVIERKVAEASKETIMQLGQKQDLMFDQYEGITLQFLVDQDLQGFLADLNSGTISAYDKLQLVQKISSKLNSFLSSNKNLKAIHLFTDKGEKISAVGSGNIANNVSGEAWLKAAIEANGRAVWLDSRPQGYSDGTPAFAIARLLKSTAYNGTSSVLLMEIKAESLSAEFEKIKMGDTGSIFIVNSSNQYMGHADKEQIGKESAIKLSPEEMQQDDGSLTMDGEAGRTLVVYSKSSKTGWFNVGEVPVAELVKDTQTISQMTIWMSVLAAILAALIGFGVIRMIGRPLQVLRNLMKEGEQGNLRGRTHFRSRDEIGQLGESFNQMMEQITVLVRQTNQSAQEVLDTAAELSDASKKTANSAREIAVATEEIASGATSLAVESEKGNELTHHMGVQMKNVVEANMNMGVSAAEVQSSSQKGISYMAELIEKTNLTEEMTRSMVEKVDKLKESTRSIRKILDMLNNITKQTNILSLNATIEAARAGAAGKGFMVVADEIRKLADQSRQSIEVVGQITETIQKEIDETVNVLSTAYPIFQEQIVSVKEADTIFRQVQENMDGFIAKLDEVSESVQQLEQSQLVLSEAMSNVSAVAEESSATSQEVASLSSEQLSVSDGLVRLSDKLEALSNSLKESLAKFQI